MKNGVLNEYLKNTIPVPQSENGSAWAGIATGPVETSDLCTAVAGPEALEVLLLHEDLQTGLRAKHILDNLEYRLEPKPRFLVELWRFDMLQEPELQEQAVRDAERANIVIISLHGDRELPGMVRNWLQSWVKSRSAGSCALVVSLDAKLQGRLAAEQIVDYLRRTALQAGLDIFPHFGDAPGSPRDWTLHPASQLQPMPPFPEWEERHGPGFRSFGGLSE